MPLISFSLFSLFFFHDTLFISFFDFRYFAIAALLPPAIDATMPFYFRCHLCHFLSLPFQAAFLSPLIILHFATPALAFIFISPRFLRPLLFMLRHFAFASMILMRRRAFFEGRRRYFQAS